MTAGILSEIDLILTYHKIPSSCRASLEIFAFQILANLSAHIHFAKIILDTPLINQIVKCLEDHPDQDLQKEACVFVRNCMSFRDWDMTKTLVENNVVISLLQYLYVIQGDEKSELLAIDSLLNIFRVGDFNEPNEYLEFANSFAGFEIYLKIFLNSTGKQIEDMDHDIEDGNHSSDDESIDTSSKTSIKKKLAAKTKYIMRTWYLKKFQETIANAQLSHEMFRSLGSLSMDSSNQQNAMLDLIHEFSGLTPHESNLKSQAQRSESETTLS